MTMRLMTVKSSGRSLVLLRSVFAPEMSKRLVGYMPMAWFLTTSLHHLMTLLVYLPEILRSPTIFQVLQMSNQRNKNQPSKRTERTKTSRQTSLLSQMTSPLSVTRITALPPLSLMPLSTMGHFPMGGWAPQDRFLLLLQRTNHRRFHSPNMVPHL